MRYLDLSDGLDESILSTLMAWLPDQKSVEAWAGPNFPYPFQTDSFLNELKLSDTITLGITDQQEKLMAFGQCYSRLNRTHLARLIVAPNLRGQGLIKVLVSELIRRGESVYGARDCSLFVMTDNISAKIAYQRLGFNLEKYPERDRFSGCDYMVRRSAFK